MEKQETRLVKIQKEICNKYGFNFEPCDLHLKIGISLNIKEKSKSVLSGLGGGWK